MRRIVGLIGTGLFAAIFLSIAPAALALQYGDLTYTSDGSSITITDCSTSAINVVVPATIDSLPVTSIGNSAFGYCTSLSNIVIPDSVTSIGSGAFSGCNRLPSISIPDSVTNIGYGTFARCTNLTSVLLGNSVISIGDSAFSECTSLSSIVIPDSVTNIGDSAFGYCISLASLSIPDGVTSIGNGAFGDCTRLAGITVDGTNPSFRSVDGVLFNKDQSMLIRYPAGKTADSYTIPDSVTFIGYGAFDCCASLSSIVISDSVTNIDMYAFVECTRLASLSIPDGVTSIGQGAFYGCTSLMSLSIPDGVTSIDPYTFYHCTRLVSLSIPASVTNIYWAFGNCASLVTITVDETNPSFRSVDGVLFNKDQSMLILYPAGRTAESYTIPDSVTSIGDFSGCASLTSIVIPAGVTDIGYGAFENCASLTTITVDGANPSFSSLDGVLFNKNQTELIQYPTGKTAPSYTIPAGITSLDNWTFEGCTNLTSIVIPASVIDIDYMAFGNCASLATITVDGANPSFSSLDGVLFNKDQSTLIRYPDGKTADSYTIPTSVTSIGQYAFRDCTSLTSLSIPDSVTSIGDSAFQDCTSLVSIEIPSSVTSIGSAFEGCTHLDRVYFEGNAPELRPYVFDGLDSAVVYYLPGTSGWGTLFGGRPTLLWNPAIDIGEGFGVGEDGFGFNIAGTADIPVVIEACTNLTEGIWIPLLTNTLSNGTLEFNDAGWTNHPSCIYRISAP